MASFHDESRCLTEGLLKRECSSIDLEREEEGSRVSPGKGLWARIWQYRFSLLIHLAIITAYAVGFSFMLDQVANRYENGPDLVNCKLIYR